MESWQKAAMLSCVGLQSMSVCGGCVGNKIGQKISFKKIGWQKQGASQVRGVFARFWGGGGCT